MFYSDIEVPEKDAEYLRKHHKTMTVPEMAKELKRAPGSVYKYMDALGLKRKPKVYNTASAAGFRRANDRLEARLVHNRIENRQEFGPPKPNSRRAKQPKS